jgi:predicted RNA methylase
MEVIWSNTDFPYMCLKDVKRTLFFKKAIKKIVKKGDIVVDVGAGSGIMSFFAAKAGAKKVYSVEIDHLLAESIQKSIEANNLEEIVSVVEGDVLKANLPKNADVVICELIDTGLMDEMQVPAINMLKKRGVISKKTKLIPSSYQTFFQLVYVDNNYYGFEIQSPKHEWPFYKNTESGWIKTQIQAVSQPVEVSSINFEEGLIECEVDKTIEYVLEKRKVNAIKISGLITLAPGIILGPTNALNGDKIIPIELIENCKKIKIKINYKMGTGLGSLLKYKVL